MATFFAFRFNLNDEMRDFIILSQHYLNVASSVIFSQASKDAEIWINKRKERIHFELTMPRLNESVKARFFTSESKVEEVINWDPHDGKVYAISRGGYQEGMIDFKIEYYQDMDLEAPGHLFKVISIDDIEFSGSL